MSELRALRQELDSVAEPGLPAIVAAGRRILRMAGGNATEATQRIAAAGSVTTDLLCCAMACGMVQQGVRPILYQAAFGTHVQEILDPNSGLHRFRPELVLLAADWHGLAGDVPIDADPSEVEEWLDVQQRLFWKLWDVLDGTLGAKIIQHTLVPPPHSFCGPAERLAPAAPERRARMLNERLQTAGLGRVHWIELDRLATTVGLRAWAGERFYASARLPFDPRFLPTYLPAFRGAWRAANGQTKRALVIDLDNTLWGGVIGDDTVDGIILGSGSAAGEAFADWGRYLRGLRARGIVLAVCSRNDPEIGATAFAHPDAVLQVSDFAAFECSWQDKVQSLRRVAQTLNLGLNALVFADDNPAECEMVQQFLPEVGVVRLGSDPSAFITLLEAGHWFDQPRYTHEDLLRADALGASRQAEALRLSASDVGAFLEDLAMQGRVFRPTVSDLPRLAQLEQKTNQFNLTTRRHSESALGDLLARADTTVLALRLKDRFGDHGLVSLLIALPDGDALRIDSWVMSCRVFARSAEAFMVRALLDIARQAGVARLVGEYRPTPRNGVVADLLPRLGFRCSIMVESMWERVVVPARDSDLDTWISAEA